MPWPNVASSEDLALLLGEARAGSVEALGRALMACRDYLLLMADRKLAPELRCKASASDVVQETFLEAQRDFERFEGERIEEWQAWLCRILVHNVVNTARRYRKAGKRALERERPLTDRASEGHTVLHLAADTPTPSAQAAAREETAALEWALPQLPEHYRRVLQLRYQEKQTFAEIGATLSCSAEAARKLWARAVSRLQQLLKASQESR